MVDVPTVYVVDDDPGALRSLCWLIAQVGLPVRAFSSGQEFLDAYRSPAPGCLVLDVRMPEMGGLEVQQQLARSGIGLPIIFITAHGDVPTCARAIKAGALEFLEKPVNGKDFLERVCAAMAYGAEQRDRDEAAAEIAARMNRLTPREKEVLDMLVAGQSLKEIATIANVRSETIWKQRASIFSKMKVESDVELVRLVTEWMNEQRR
jgi:two-component system, LuxR family, response regulator FixJ